MKRLSREKQRFFFLQVKKIEAKSRFRESKQNYQHGETSVYKHSLRVAYESCVFAEKYNLPVNYESLIRGAILHDYFLYDWHDKTHEHKRPHGFHHAKVALGNAMTDFELNDTEKNIILRHMFPLTIIPPKCLEAWIVCMVDKKCSCVETMNRRKS